jgi:hypothetical protein
MFQSNESSRGCITEPVALLFLINELEFGTINRQEKMEFCFDLSSVAVLSDAREPFPEIRNVAESSLHIPLSNCGNRGGSCQEWSAE